MAGVHGDDPVTGVIQVQFVTSGANLVHHTCFWCCYFFEELSYRTMEGNSLMTLVVDDVVANMVDS